uniref:Regulatory protein E2 n=1 Tax=Bovine papillomavirus type 5 TaxID=2491661 RepID=A0A3G8G7M7_BPV5|nr:E2 [Bos taurus papillomavirus 5]
MAAAERLSAAQETQMTLLEKPSFDLKDHISYYGALRTENTIFYAARKKGLTSLGHCPVPTLATAAANAKAAIEMQLLLKDLLRSPFAKNDWSLNDVSHERYKAPPSDTLKRKPRIVEVIFDKDPQNKTWYTLWDEVYVCTVDGWTLTTSGADATGIFVNMQGSRQYYEHFGEDAQRFGTSGTWEVIDQNQRFHFPPSSRADTTDGLPGLQEEPRRGDGPTCSGPAPAIPDSPSRCLSRGFAGRDPGCHRNRHRVHPYILSGGQGILVTSSSSSTVQGPLSSGSSQHSQSRGRPPSPDSTETERARTPVNSDRQRAGEFDLLKGGCRPCCLIEGNGNKVKCLRFRLKKSHRTRFLDITTTFWATGDEGSDRQGKGTILITFTDTTQRDLFLGSVSIPGELSVRRITISTD